jgi:hypothetical protein
MICRFAALSLAALFTIPARAQDFVVAQNQTEERPAGLLALPEIFGDYPCESITPKKVKSSFAFSAMEPLESCPRTKADMSTPRLSYTNNPEIGFGSQSRKDPPGLSAPIRMASCPTPTT